MYTGANPLLTRRITLANMGNDVEPGALAAEISQRATGYLLTVTDRMRPHAVPVEAELAEGALTVRRPGARTAAYARERPAVSLLWPPVQQGGYTLIVDGDATVEDDGEDFVLQVRVVRAVLHRPALVPAGAGSEGALVGDEGCGSDCVEIISTH